MDIQKYLKELSEGLELRGENEEYIKKCVDYAENLLKHGMPVIFDLKHLALLIGMEGATLKSYVFGDEDKLYFQKEIPKKNGGKRKLTIPCYTLKYLQRWILDNILNRMHVSDNCMGFTEGRSILTNANSHLGAKAVLNIDIKDFFPSITLLQVYRLFRYYGYTREMSFVFAKLCTYQERLPQGSPASPYISNLVCLKLDKRINALVEAYRGKYTRYADDITISGTGRLEKLIPIIKTILAEEGFELNHEKTRVLHQGQRQEVTGLIINSGKATVSKSFKRELQQEIYYCRKYGFEDHQRHVGDEHRFYKEHLYGKAYFVYMIEPEVGKQLLKALEGINWEA